MRLKKLEIYGFKSFADRVEIVFDDGITGIVGPNGSGKSNINDAVRWVLGEQSARMLRGAKMEDVIFNGTEKRKRLSYCEVTLVFDNTDGGLAIDFAEVAVTRRVYRSGEGEYFINHAACRLKDILDLFRDTGIGRDGYSLIGQGRIDEVLSARSEDRRQVFEEAAGIVKYKTRRREAEKRLENTRTNLARVEDILNELTGRLEPLRRESEAAREYLALRDELKGLEINVFLIRSTRYEARIEELKQNAQELSAAISENDEKRRLLLAEREKAQAKLDEYEQATALLRESVQELIRRTEADSGSVRVAKEKLEGEKREKARIEALIEASAGNREDIERTLKELENGIADQKALLAGIDRDTEECDNGVKELEGIAADLEARSEDAKKALIAAMNRISDVRSARARYTVMLENISGRRKTLAENRAAEASKTADRRGDLEEEESRLQKDRNELEAARAESVNVAARLRDSNEKTDALSGRLASLQAEKREVQSREKLLREMQRDYEGYNNAVRQVLTQGKRSRSLDVRGAVAEIIRVPSEYERAVEMALGASLQNVVVGTEDDAKQLIAYLRENRLGRATFLPVSSVRGRTLDARERQVLSMRGCRGLASELIDYDPKYEEIVRFLLGRTVIAENLDAGIPIMRAGHQAFRLVTLEGDVMNPGGSMTGGSVQSRMTSLLSREREINEHEERIREIDRELAGIGEELKKCGTEREDLRARRSEMYDEVHRLELVCERGEAQLDAVKEAVRARESRLVDIDDEIAELIEQEKDVKDRLSALDAQDDNENSQKITQAEITELQHKLFEARSELEAKREKLTALKVRQASASKDLSSMEADNERLRRDMETIGAAREDNIASLETITASTAVLEDEIASLDEALTALKNTLEEERGRFNRSDADRAAVQKKLSEITERGDRLNSESEMLNDKKSRCDVSLTRVEGEYKQMCDRIWEDYELTYAGAEPYRRDDFKLGEADRRIAEIRARIKIIGNVNVNAVDEYRETQTRVDELSAQKEDLTKADNDLQKIIEDLTRRMAARFSEQFKLLGQNFKETFVKLFGGGQASLELTDPGDPLGSDIEIKAQPPGKKLTLLSLLSGGERALTAIAIVFAMLKLKPTPFCFLDEIEAALDDANIDNFAEYLHEFSKSTQFVVVTHRKGTMERCDSLYGVAMEEKGVTRMVSVHLGSETA